MAFRLLGSVGNLYSVVFKIKCPLKMVSLIEDNFAYHKEGDASVICPVSYPFESQHIPFSPSKFLLYKSKPLHTMFSLSL